MSRQACLSPCVALPKGAVLSNVTVMTTLCPSGSQENEIMAYTPKSSYPRGSSVQMVLHNLKPISLLNPLGIHIFNPLSYLKDSFREVGSWAPCGLQGCWVLFVLLFFPNEFTFLEEIHWFGSFPDQSRKKYLLLSRKVAQHCHCRKTFLLPLVKLFLSRLPYYIYTENMSELD